MSPPRDRAAAGVLVIATVLGVWLGLTAPSTSPVQAPVATTQVADPPSTASAPGPTP